MILEDGIYFTKLLRYDFKQNKVKFLIKALSNRLNKVNKKDLGRWNIFYKILTV